VSKYKFFVLNFSVASEKPQDATNFYVSVYHCALLRWQVLETNISSLDPRQNEIDGFVKEESTKFEATFWKLMTNQKFP
jgi:hypothetical protein